MMFAFAMKDHLGERFVPHDYWSLHRALTSLGARRTTRANPIGRPWKWRLPD
jgi:hypothetical protein